MQQIADWLEQLGLGQYAGCFAENDITVAILPAGVERVFCRRSLVAHTKNLKLSALISSVPNASDRSGCGLLAQQLASHAQPPVIIRELSIGNRIEGARICPALAGLTDRAISNIRLAVTPAI